MAFSRTGLSSTSQPAQAGPGSRFRPASSDGCTRSFVIQPHHLVRERSAAADAPPSGREHQYIDRNTAEFSAERKPLCAGTRRAPSILTWSASCLAAHGPFGSSERCSRPGPARCTTTCPAQCPCVRATCTVGPTPSCRGAGTCPFGGPQDGSQPRRDGLRRPFRRWRHRPGRCADIHGPTAIVRRGNRRQRRRRGPDRASDPGIQRPGIAACQEGRGERRRRIGPGRSGATRGQNS